MDYVRIECDGVDYTHKLKAYGTHSVLFLNIKSYAGGTRPWNNKSKDFSPQDINDGLLEVFESQHRSNMKLYSAAYIFSSGYMILTCNDHNIGSRTR